MSSITSGSRIEAESAGGRILWESSRLGQSKAFADRDILHSGCGGRKGRYSYRRREVPMRQEVYAIFGAMPEPREGRVWPDRRIHTAFENAVARAGLKDFRFHDLRHHFASWFMMRGGDLLALQKNLGHRTLAMTQKYAHLSPDYLRSAMDRTARRPGLQADAFSTKSTQSGKIEAEQAVSA